MLRTKASVEKFLPKSQLHHCLIVRKSRVLWWDASFTGPVNLPPAPPRQTVYPDILFLWHCHQLGQHLLRYDICLFNYDAKLTMMKI